MALEKIKASCILHIGPQTLNSITVLRLYFFSLVGDRPSRGLPPEGVSYPVHFCNIPTKNAGKY